MATITSQRHLFFVVQSVDVVVCSITPLRSDLYFARLANLAGADALPNAKTTNQRHFGSAYADAMITAHDVMDALMESARNAGARVPIEVSVPQ